MKGQVAITEGGGCAALRGAIVKSASDNQSTTLVVHARMKITEIKWKKTSISTFLLHSSGISGGWR